MSSAFTSPSNPAGVVFIQSRDLRAAQKYIGELYAIANFESFVDYVLAATPKLIRSEVTTFHDMGVASPFAPFAYFAVAPAEIDTTVRRETWPLVMHEHPLLAEFQRSRVSGTQTLSEVLSAREFHRTALYQEFYRKMDTKDQLVCNFTQGDGLVHALSLHRSSRFTQRERLLMEGVRPHIIQAHANALVVSRMERESSVLRAGLTLAECGIVTLESKRKIRLTTGPALKWIAEYFGPSNDNNGLPETLELWLRSHDAGVRRTLDIPVPRDPLVITRGHKRLLVRRLSEAGEIALLLREQQVSIEPDSLTMLGLTRRETEVLAQISEGKTNREVGAALAMSPRTVQTHLEHIYRRVGVETRAGAVAKAFQARTAAQSDSSSYRAPPVRTLRSHPR